MDAYDELYVYTMGRQNFILQHVVDANIAQGAPAINPPHIGVIFSLVGLYLHVEKGFTGTQVQNAHRVMGNVKRSWPNVVWPTERGAMTAATVLAMPVGQARDDGIDEWCRQVWAAFRGANRDMVSALVSDYKIVDPTRSGTRP
jgi:hypothetical protein